ncbi:MAG: HAMP domain-containing histidine kinase [Thermoflavifilum sp.]|uniref:sensor histidine kinase n=1 Tax=Thermoflavifilum sp. TaxID=1968839 RepID=UPI0018A6813A|nr:HAMP domain-containing sensor histidine kinase [Thermoflavifilum sp.]QOR75102.1 MAG: HAMP domain-containing histidine kinase [Thermoflavifilum sp.]
MKSSTLRKLVVIGALLMICVLAAQVYWLQKTYALEEKEFNVKVHSALNEVVQRIRLSQRDSMPFIEAVERPAANYYIADIKYRINGDSIENYLKQALEENDLFTTYQFGIYNAATKKFEHVETESFNPEDSPHIQPFPSIHKDENYLAVLFTNRRKYIISEMNFWIFSTLALILVIIAFAVTLLILLRQKLLSEIQKDFINNMTHEFRTPISTIQLSVEVLKQATPVQQNARLLNYTRIIEHESAHLEQQVERVLQIAQIERANPRLQIEKLDAHAIIQRCVMDFEYMIQQKSGRFILNLQARQTCIEADAVHFTNILFNLIDNAIKYSPVPVITLHTWNDAQRIFISVQDNGIGIPRQYHKLLFSQFFRVPTGNLHEVKGFGLGLNYVKLYTRAFKGKVSVESEPGKGSNFTLSFPLCKTSG